MTCKKAKEGVREFLKERVTGTHKTPWCEACDIFPHKEINTCELINLLRKWGMCHWDKDKGMEQMTPLGLELEEYFIEGNEFEADLRLMAIKEKLDV